MADALRFADRVKLRREQLGLGLNAAARRCDIAPQKLADAEAGKDSRASSVVAIARGLGVSADYLLGLTAEGATLPRTPDQAAPPEPDRLAALEARVAEIGTRQTEGLDTLTDLIAQVTELRTRLEDVERARKAPPAGRRRKGAA